jgi:hypothetical protein
MSRLTKFVMGSGSKPIFRNIFSRPIFSEPRNLSDFHGAERAP